ncbi:Multiple myeloma tumor-associated protein 2 [Talaromyces pinophilus]|nr:Multiple myeloma tumor-associated protein 2 [Talaromyces pinophilus]
MDLVAGVRKEGSRGGRDSFKWSDVKQSSHRENYLGHSIMAPVGRWQQNRDLNWYAKTDDSSAADKAKQEREEEIRRIKEAEQDAMALALGLPVAPRASNNANLTPLGGQEVRKAVQDATEGEGDGDGDGGRGIGFGSYGGVVGNDAEDEILAPIGMDSAVRPLGQEKDGRDRHRSRHTTETQTGNIVIVTTVNTANTGGTDPGLARCRDLQDQNVATEDQRQTVVVTPVVPSAIDQVLHDVIVSAIVAIMKAAEMHTIGIIVVEQDYPSVTPICFY